MMQWKVTGLNLVVKYFIVILGLHNVPTVCLLHTYLFSDFDFIHVQISFQCNEDFFNTIITAVH